MQFHSSWFSPSVFLAQALILVFYSHGSLAMFSQKGVGSSWGTFPQQDVASGWNNLRQKWPYHQTKVRREVQPDLDVASMNISKGDDEASHRVLGWLQSTSSGNRVGQPIPHHSETAITYKTATSVNQDKIGDYVYADPGLDGQSGRVRQKAYKTLLCKYYTATGVCQYGNACRFAHGESELIRLAPDISTSQVGSLPSLEAKEKSDRQLNLYRNPAFKAYKPDISMPGMQQTTTPAGRVNSHRYSAIRKYKDSETRDIEHTWKEKKPVTASAALLDLQQDETIDEISADHIFSLRKQIDEWVGQYSLNNPFNNQLPMMQDNQLTVRSLSRFYHDKGEYGDAFLMDALLCGYPVRYLSHDKRVLGLLGSQVDKGWQSTEDLQYLIVSTFSATYYGYIDSYLPGCTIKTIKLIFSLEGVEPPLIGVDVIWHQAFTIRSKLKVLLSRSEFLYQREVVDLIDQLNKYKKIISEEEREKKVSNFYSIMLQVKHCSDK